MSNKNELLATSLGIDPAALEIAKQELQPEVVADMALALSMRNSMRIQQACNYSLERYEKAKAEGESAALPVKAMSVMLSAIKSTQSIAKDLRASSSGVERVDITSMPPELVEQLEPYKLD